MEQPASSNEVLPTDPGDDILVDVLEVLAQVGVLYNQFLATREASIIDKAITLAEALSESTSINISGLEPLLLQMKQLRSEVINPSDTTKPEMEPNEQTQTPTAPNDQKDELQECSWMLRRYESYTEVEDVDGAIAFDKEAISTTPVGHPDRLVMLGNLNSLLSCRYDRLGRLEDLEMAIGYVQEAIEAVQINDPDRPALLGNLGGHYLDRYIRFGDLEDLRKSIELKQNAVEAIAINNPDRPILLSNLGISLSNRFERLGSVEDLEKAITITKEALAAAPASYPPRYTIMTSLGSHLGERYKQSGSLEDLEEAIEITNQAVKETPAGYSQLAVRLNNLGNYLAYRYQRLGSLEDLEKAIKLNEQAVEITSGSHPERASRLSNLGYRFIDRYKRLGDLDDLERAIRYSKQAIEATPTDDPHQASRLDNLANCLSLRYSRLGAVDDLEIAINLEGQAVEATPKTHSDWANRINNLGCKLGERFDRLGDIKDLEEAIDRLIQAVNATPENNPYRPSRLGNLSIHLHRRYRHMGVLKDLEKSIELAEQAVEAIPENDPSRAFLLSNLSDILRDRCERLGDLRDIEKAIECCRSSVHDTPADNAYRAGRLSNLSSDLMTRYRRTGSLDDLREAVEWGKQAYELLPADHYLLTTMMLNFAHALKDRYNNMRESQDLEKAIRLVESAIEKLSPDHVLYGTALCTYGSLLVLRESFTTESIYYALGINLKAWDSKLLPPHQRVTAGHTAANIYHALGKFQESSTLYEGVVRLLPLLSPRRLVRDDQHHQLAAFSSLPSAAASMTLHAGAGASDALRLLELGRGITTGLVIDYRSSAPELEKHHPDIHNQLNIIRTRLDSPIDYEKPYEVNPFVDHKRYLDWDPSCQRQKDIQDFENLLTTIRNLAGFQGFLQPPPPEDLMKIARQGPIIIVNCNSLRSDAILVTYSTIKALPLPKLVFHEACKQMAQLSLKLTRGKIRTYPSRNTGTEELLLWLWDVAVEPIFEELQLLPTDDDSSLPRVWWIGVSILAMAPFHAAGDHSPGSRRNTLCRAISSYTPTIKSLSYAREKELRLLNSASKLLLVAMPETPNHNPLKSSDEEVRVISALVRTGTNTETLVSPSAAEVVAKLTSCDAVHFTCHGVSSAKNSLDSHLLLCKARSSELDTPIVDRLTVEAISSTKLKTAQIAFLSACSTARIDVHHLSDQSIHISSAFQLSGFAHVLATLWQSDDRASLQVSCDFYRLLFDSKSTGSDGGHREVSVAFHKAVKRLRDENWRQPLLWACFIHTGA